MRARTVQDHATDGPQEDPQGGHGNDGDQDGVERLQHVAGSADLVGLHKVGVFSDLLHWRGGERRREEVKDEMRKNYKVSRGEQKVLKSGIPVKYNALCEITYGFR